MYQPPMILSASESFRGSDFDHPDVILDAYRKAVVRMRKYADARHVEVDADTVTVTVSVQSLNKETA